MSWDRYGSDVLGQPTPSSRTRSVAQVEARRGLVVEEVTTGWVGAVVRVEKTAGMHTVTLEDRHGAHRVFRLGPGFWVDGEPVVLVPPQRVTAPVATRTASGSRMAPLSRARVARTSRIWVEGKHDAELVEKVWGADLRVEGVVVEMLDGVDHLQDRLEEFGPTPESRVGVLVDHLVPGSKEARIADAVAERFPPQSVLVVGHPYVEVWQAVKPHLLGLPAWPTISRDVEWKRGILKTLGWPAQTQMDVAQGWQRILSQVTTYTDVEPALLGRGEELIDFVTVDE